MVKKERRLKEMMCQKKNAIYRDSIYSECIAIHLYNPANQCDCHQIQNKSCFAIFCFNCK